MLVYCERWRMEGEPNLSSLYLMSSTNHRDGRHGCDAFCLPSAPPIPPSIPPSVPRLTSGYTHTHTHTQEKERCWGWDGLSSVPRLPSPAYHLTAFRPCLPSHLPVPPFRMSPTPVCPLRSLLLPVAPLVITFQRNLPPFSSVPNVPSLPSICPTLLLLLLLPSCPLTTTATAVLRFYYLFSLSDTFLPAPTFWSSFLSHHLPSHSQPIHFCHCLFHLRFLSLPSVPVLAIPVYPCIPFCPHIQSPIFPVWPHPLHVCSRSRLFVAPCHHACGCSLS